jgi:4-hydroxy-tetrahydrodipicolinate synthase
MHVSDSLYHIGRHPTAVIKGIKCALGCLGICDDFMAEPFHRFRDGERARVQTCLRELTAGVENCCASGKAC